MKKKSVITAAAALFLGLAHIGHAQELSNRDRIIGTPTGEIERPQASDPTHFENLDATNNSSSPLNRGREGISSSAARGGTNMGDLGWYGSQNPQDDLKDRTDYGHYSNSLNRGIGRATTLFELGQALSNYVRNQRQLDQRNQEQHRRQEEREKFELCRQCEFEPQQEKIIEQNNSER